MSPSPPSISSTSGTEMQRHELTLIVAATSSMGIGLKGGLPWTGLKKEMAYFARVTKRAAEDQSNAVIMGRKTWDSIPPRFRPLKDRANIVITRSPSTTGLGDHVASSMGEALTSLSQLAAVKKAFVIGGAEIYREALKRPEAKRILLTRILSDFDCDTHFPIKLSEDGTGEGFERKSKEDLDAWVGENVPEGVQEENGTRYVFEMWEKVE